MKGNELTRRDFLRLSAIGAAGAVLAACAPAATPPPAEVPAKEAPPAAPPAEAVSKYKEAPMLAERVKAGQLPPIDERLPANPAVVKGRDAIGTYGGTVRQIHPDPNSFVSNYGWMAERPVGYSDLDLKTLEANSFESWEVNEDATQFTIKLRAGMKWSDGAPVTTEDVRFWYEDFLMNADITSTVEVQYQRGGEPLKIEVIDDYTFKIIFAAPYGDFPARLTRQETPRFFIPSRYMKQFHAKYRPKEELDAAVKEAGFETWIQLFNSKNWWVTWAANYDIGHPSLQPWIITERPAPGILVMERNPYYWKVDEAGNQLPYIDKLAVDLVPNPENITLKIIQGELDYVGPHEVSVARYPLYKEHEPNQNYIVADLISVMTDRYIILPNHTHKDPVMREIVNDPRWVQALSVAINRDEINENLYFGLAKMGQASVIPGSKYYTEEVAQAWAQYDPELANKLLDEMGLDKRDAEGYRLRPDGQRLKYHFEHAGIRVGVATAEYAELVTAMWREVGIDASSEELSEQLWWERVQNNEPDLWIWHNDRCTDMLFPIDPSFFMPIQTWHGHATLWSQWYESRGQRGEEPPDYIKARYDIYEQMKATPSEDERVELGKKLLKMHAERPLVIGVVLECPAPLIYNKKLRNLPKPKMPNGWDTWCDSVYHPEAYYYEA